MTPLEEIERIKKDFAPHWARLETSPAIKQAIADANPIKLAELASMFVYGNTWSESALGDYHPLRNVVSVKKSDPKWFDILELEVRKGNHVNLEEFAYPADEKMCQNIATHFGLKGSMNPAKTIFFFRHST